ncbi:MAG: hypothetical protein ACXU7D_12495 [Burkholderiaceae bacterium]
MAVKPELMRAQQRPEFQAKDAELALNGTFWQMADTAHDKCLNAEYGLAIRERINSNPCQTKFL